MRTETLQMMPVDELEAYAKQMGFTLKACDSKADKIDLIQRRRDRAVTIGVLGLDLSVPVKRFRASKFSDAVFDPARTSESLMAAFRDLLGEQQFDKLISACVDDDGEPDEDAVAFAFNTILRSEELKNY